MQQRAYPDDWDDTACSIAAVVRYDAQVIDGKAQAIIARGLIECEQSPGGPYKTWVGNKTTKEWNDIDPVVNANIGTMLMLLGVYPRGLEEYFDRLIQTNALVSPYYLSDISTIYFLSKWYKGSHRAALESRIRYHIGRTTSVLDLAMLVTAAYSLGTPDIINQQHLRRLLNSEQQGIWPAQGLYYEPPQGGHQRYAGSSALTTAFVLEALCISNNQVADQTKLVKQPIDITNITVRATGKPLSSETIALLRKADQAGWVAYTIYDDFWDNEGDPLLLGKANQGARKSIRCFRRAVPGRKFARLVEATFVTMDNANTWEVAMARDRQQLPDYGDLRQLALRSWGWLLAPTAVMVAQGHSVNGRAVLQLREFLKHYIIARQLFDDAHDWQEDLAASRVTYVVACMLKKVQSTDSDVLRVHFWSQTMPEIEELIGSHLVQARKLLLSSRQLPYKKDFLNLLDSLENSLQTTKRERSVAQAFIKSFSRTNNSE